MNTEPNIEQTKENIPNNTSLFDMIGKIIGEQSPDTNSTPTQTNNNTDTKNPSNEGVGGDLISSLLSNPELLAKLPQMLGMLKPMLGNLDVNTNTTTPNNTQPPSEQINPLNLLLGANTQKQSNTENYHATLLNAMKPYLGPQRQQAIDYIIKLSRLGDILKTL